MLIIHIEGGLTIKNKRPICLLYKAMQNTLRYVYSLVLVSLLLRIPCLGILDESPWLCKALAEKNHTQLAPLGSLIASYSGV